MASLWLQAMHPELFYVLLHGPEQIKQRLSAIDSDILSSSLKNNWDGKLLSPHPSGRSVGRIIWVHLVASIIGVYPRIT